MKNKFILSGTSNDGFRHKYHINKKKGFRKAFLRFMNELGFDENKIGESFYQRYESEPEDEENIHVRWVIDVDEIEDDVWHFRDNNYDVDVFFGHEKVFVIVRTKNRRNMVDFLKKDAEWKSDEEFEKIRKDNLEKKRQRALKEMKNKKNENTTKTPEISG